MLCLSYTHKASFFFNRKRKSFSRRLLESFRESPKMTKKSQLMNKYVKNKLNEEDAKLYVSDRIFNSLKGTQRFCFLWI